ncbi:uncharacterized protein LOC122065169 [Macadamia integrifolia]|nr:uncharacterized protein LOC122065169 [Macadamia integrifolia]
MCYPHHTSLQSKDERKFLKQSFDGYSYKEFADLDLFRRCFYPHDWQYDEFYPKWERVLKSYIGEDGLGVPMLDRLWQHVLASTGGNQSDPSQLYKNAVGRVEIKARAVYIEEDIIKCSNEEFLQVMTEQGCFILQVALCSLGGPKPLGYPPDDPLFGEKRWNKEVIRFLVNRYIFSINNQISLVILEALMKQGFFQKVLKSGKWKRPNDLARMVLYDFLVEPMLEHQVKSQGNYMMRLHGLFHKRMMSRRWHQEQPITLRQALWLLLTGPGSSHGRGANHIEEGDYLYTNFPTVRGAMELQAAGISFKSEEGMGTRQIKFKKTMLGGYLYLPCICMEPHTMTLFQKVINDEVEFELDINRRSVSAYVSLMKELIRSRDEVKVLVTQGIIEVDPEYEQQLPDALLKLQTSEVGNSHHLVAVRRQICRNKNKA